MALVYERNCQMYRAATATAADVTPLAGAGEVGEVERSMQRRWQDSREGVAVEEDGEVASSSLGTLSDPFLPTPTPTPAPTPAPAASATSWAAIFRPKTGFSVPPGLTAFADQSYLSDATELYQSTAAAAAAAAAGGGASKAARGHAEGSLRARILKGIHDHPEWGAAAGTTHVVQVPSPI